MAVAAVEAGDECRLVDLPPVKRLSLGVRVDGTKNINTSVQSEISCLFNFTYTDIAAA